MRRLKEAMTRLRKSSAPDDPNRHLVYILGSESSEARSKVIEGLAHEVHSWDFNLRSDEQIELTGIRNEGNLIAKVEYTHPGSQHYKAIDSLAPIKPKDSVYIPNVRADHIRVSFKPDHSGWTAGAFSKFLGATSTRRKKQQGRVIIAYSVQRGHRRYTVERMAREEREAMHSQKQAGTMVQRIDERQKLSRSELHAFLRGRPLVARMKSSAGSAQFEAKLTLELGPDVSMVERTALLDALTNNIGDGRTGYVSGFATDPAGNAFPVVGTTAWLAYVASNSDRIVWKGRPLAAHSPAEQRVAIESWLATEHVPPIMGASTSITSKQLLAAEGGPYASIDVPPQEAVPLYSTSTAKHEPARPVMAPIVGAVAAIDDDLKLSAESEAEADVHTAHEDAGVKIEAGSSLTPEVTKAIASLAMKTVGVVDPTLAAEMIDYVDAKADEEKFWSAKFKKATEHLLTDSRAVITEDALPAAPEGYAYDEDGRIVYVGE